MNNGESHRVDSAVPNGERARWLVVGVKNGKFGHGWTAWMDGAAATESRAVTWEGGSFFTVLHKLICGAISTVTKSIITPASQIVNSSEPSKNYLVLVPSTWSSSIAGI